MFLFLRSRCSLKTYCAGISRNVSTGTKVTNSFVLPKEKSELKWTNGALLHLKRSQSNTAADNLQELMAVFPDIVKDLTQDRDICVHPDVSKWFSELVQQNVPGGKMYRAVIIMETYRNMAKPKDQTPENIRLAMILGWCVEMCIASLLICDDILDGSETRRGAPCWYKRDGVGLLAVNDVSLLAGGAYALLRKYFHDKSYYVNILETFQDSFLKVAIGQVLDTAKFDKSKLEFLTYEYFEKTATYKSSLYSFILPVQFGMHLAGCVSEFEQAKPTLFDLGHFFQIENDFKDCYENPKITGKIGTDIQEAKCTWLSVKALQKASPQQRKVMEECFGSPDPLKVAAVKNVYNELDLLGEYSVYRNNFSSNIRFEIQKSSNEKLRKLLHKICDILKV